MYEGKKIVSVTPAGRKRYVQILAPYLLRSRDIIDRHIWWINTNIREDIEYIESLCEAFPDFFELRFLDPLPETYNNYNIHRFFHECIQPDTMYFRLDDDICWMHPDCMANWAKARLSNSSDFVIYANIVNNAICSHARFGAMYRDKGMPEYHCLCNLGWKDPIYAERVHRNFLRKLEEGTIDDYRFPHLWHTGPGETRISINAIAWHGSEFAKFNGQVGRDEEDWISIIKPKQISMGTSIAGDALLTHFAFYTQRKHLEGQTNLLDHYKVISQGVLASIGESLPE